jgi:hypothetical protein
MRLYEFANSAIAATLKTIVGRHQSRSASAKYNWAGLNELLKDDGIEMNYQVYDALYKTSPVIQELTKDYGPNGVEFEVPGAPDAKNDKTDSEKSQDSVNKVAASAAMKNISS